MNDSKDFEDLKFVLRMLRIAYSEGAPNSVIADIIDLHHRLTNKIDEAEAEFKEDLT